MIVHPRVSPTPILWAHKSKIDCQQQNIRVNHVFTAILKMAITDNHKLLP